MILNAGGAGVLSVGMMSRPLVAVLVLVVGSLALAQAKAAAPKAAAGPAKKAAARAPYQGLPPAGNEIAAADRRELTDGAAALGRDIEALAGELKSKPDLLALLPDVRIYHKAVDWPLRYGEPIDVKKARAALATAKERIAQLRQGSAPWVTAGGARAYVSRIDGSVQPYVLIPPKSFDLKARGPYRVDLFFHGRSERLMELDLITGKGVGDAPTNPPDEKRFVVFPYGRYCCANKFAGEIDTLEILEHLKAQYPIDEDRVVVTGFSMGGAAAWHHAVHYADRWAAVSPGAGFAESRQYQNMDASGEWAALPEWRKKLMHLYDCPDWALNLSMVPTVSYAGELDKQKQSGDVMEKALADLGLKLERVWGPKTEHRYEPNAKKDIARRLDEYAARGRNRVPKELHFVTWTLRYNTMHWVTVDALGKHWEQARVDGAIAPDGTIALTTKNVEELTVRFPPGLAPAAVVKVTLDGATVPAPAVGADRSFAASYVRANGTWGVPLSKPDPAVRKRHGLQGPIDDAFLEPFVMVRGTGRAANEMAGKWAEGEFKHATAEWRKIFRGEAPAKADTEVGPAELGRNLVLFGDPSSNALIAKIAERLPVKWDARTITVGPRTYDAAKHALILICPNPLNSSRYVVLNSGFTFRQADHKTNSRQIAKLPDYAVVDLTAPPDDQWPGKVVEAGFFDERWRIGE